VVLGQSATVADGSELHPSVGFQIDQNERSQGAPQVPDPAIIALLGITTHHEQ
jgi:hypothetical protein